ncbi:MAG: 3-dehydroquinate synthase, partial [Spirochaetota bacterium]
VSAADRCGVCISKKVLSLHGDRIRAAFPPDAFAYFVMEDGEKYKSYKNIERLLCDMLREGFTRHSLLIAVGGGVVGDFAGFAASVYMRGIRIIQLPTTLLAMVDSSIGGKTAVNIGSGKNIAGAFHPPVMIAADTLFLETLPDDQWREGLAECVKHAVIGEQVLFDMFSDNDLSALKKPELRSSLVALSAGFKVGVVTRDEKEMGERANLNFGHTAAHAIESAKKYKISHGAAVGIGMEIITRLCENTGRITKKESGQILSLIDKYGLAPGIRLPSAETLISHMKFDKKNMSGKICFVLLDSLFHPIYNAGAEVEDIRRAVSMFGKRD